MLERGLAFHSNRKPFQTPRAGAEGPEEVLGVEGKRLAARRRGVGREPAILFSVSS